MERSEEVYAGAAALPARIAGNLLPLCGVQNPTKGDGRTRYLAFPELAVTTIRRGAPTQIPDESLVIDPGDIIPTATVGRCNPDTLAAAVLAGANYVFAPIAEANVGVLKSPTFQELSPRMRLGVAAGLTFQAFREQPGLFAAAAQAAHIQDAKVNGNLWDLPKTSAPLDPHYPRTPTAFNMLDVFKSTAWNLELGRLSLADVFVENCLDVARKPGAIILPSDPDHVVPKVIAHPGDFARLFLNDVARFPPEREWLTEPLRPDAPDYATLMATWLANDFSCVYLEDGRETIPFRRANNQLEQRMLS